MEKFTFEIKGNEFLKNGKPFKIISGDVHYFRNLPQTWKNIFKKHTGITPPDVPTNAEKCAYGTLELSQSAGFFENLHNLSSPIFSNVPLCMEKYGIGYGYIAYQTRL